MLRSVQVQHTLHHGVIFFLEMLKIKQQTTPTNQQEKFKQMDSIESIV